MKPEEYSRRQMDLSGWAIDIETYKLGEVYHCTIASVDPGARFARADGSTKQEPEERPPAKAPRGQLGEHRGARGPDLAGPADDRGAQPHALAHATRRRRPRLHP